MRSDDAIRRLRAWHEGKPIPRYQTLHVPKPDDDDALILAFVRMGGESAPWGLALGHPGESPAVWTVPEPRNRDLVADMMAACAPTLLRHFRHPELTAAGERLTHPENGLPLRQLWLPNGSHLDMLHALAYAYAFTKFGAAARALMLNRLGRLAGWLFREAQRPGQMTVMVATDVLRRAYTFPSDDIRQAHLGYLMAWLGTRGGRERRLEAAREEEQHSISTTLDPAVEREQLDDEVERWNEDRNGSSGKKAKASIERVLREELERRYQLTDQAIETIRRDKRRVNVGVGALEAESVREMYYQYVRLEEKKESEVDGPVWVPSPETDRHAAAAASRYLVHSASAEFYEAALLHDDAELQEEVLAAGDGIRGIITRVEDVSETRATCPIWTIRAKLTGPLRVREGTELCVAGLPTRHVRVDDIKTLGPIDIEVTVEVMTLKTVPRENPGKTLAATDPKLVTKDVTLLPINRSQISRMKNQRIWETSHPGSWLTHAIPAGGVDDTAEFAEAPKSLDQIFGRR